MNNLENIMKKSILGILILCGVLSASCIRSSDETVTCSESKLMWQDDKSAKTIQKNWSGAIEHCASLTFAGYSDWRLPNKNELLSIVDNSKYNLAINSAFKNTTSHYYWSSTTYAGTTNNAWYVDFYYGHTNNYYKYDSKYVRCVRAGQ